MLYPDSDETQIILGACNNPQEQDNTGAMLLCYPGHFVLRTIQFLATVQNAKPLQFLQSDVEGEYTHLSVLFFTSRIKNKKAFSSLEFRNVNARKRLLLNSSVCYNVKN